MRPKAILKSLELIIFMCISLKIKQFRNDIIEDVVIGIYQINSLFTLTFYPHLNQQPFITIFKLV